MSLFAGIEIPGHPDLENVRRLDLLAIPFIRRSHRIGICIDKPRFPEIGSQFSAEAREVEKDIASYIPPEKLAEFNSRSEVIEEEYGDASLNASSAEQIGKLLFDVLGLGRDKQLKRTSTGRVSTGKKQLELIRLDHPVVPKILRHRELSKLVSNYCNKLPLMAKFHPRSVGSNSCPVCELPHDVDQWRIHGEMGTTRAETGRINHKNPNLGNIATRTKDGQEVQACFIAPPGKVLVNRDASQIELRCLAHLANCRSMIDIYDRDGDIHDDTCRLVFKLAADVKPDKIKHRMAAKRVAFGIQNGTTGRGLYMQLVMDYGMNGLPVPDWLTEEWCDQFIEDFLDTRPEIRPLFELQWYRARRYGMTWTSMGRVRLVPEVRSYHPWIKHAGLRQAQNLPVTGIAADQLKLAMGKSDKALREMYDNGIWCWPLLTIHDAIKVEADEEYGEVVAETLRWSIDTCMTDEETGEHRFRVPLKSDGSIDQRWVVH